MSRKPPPSTATPLFPLAETGVEVPSDATPKAPTPREPIPPLHYTIATYTVSPNGPSGWGMITTRGGHRRELAQHLCHADGEFASQHAHEFLAMLDRANDRDAPPRVCNENPTEVVRARVLAMRAALFVDIAMVTARTRVDEPDPEAEPEPPSKPRSLADVLARVKRGG